MRFLNPQPGGVMKKRSGDWSFVYRRETEVVFSPCYEEAPETQKLRKPCFLTGQTGLFPEVIEFSETLSL